MPAIVVAAMLIAGCNSAPAPGVEHWRFQPGPLDTTVSLDSQRPSQGAAVSDAPLFEPAQGLTLETDLDLSSVRSGSPDLTGMVLRSDIISAMPASFANASDSRFINELTATAPVLHPPQLATEGLHDLSGTVTLSVEGLSPATATAPRTWRVVGQLDPSQFDPSGLTTAGPVPHDFPPFSPPAHELRFSEQSVIPGQSFVPEPNSASMAAVMMTYILLRRRHDCP
jgi:hypothetical protein